MARRDFGVRTRTTGAGPVLEGSGLDGAICDYGHSSIKMGRPDVKRDANIKQIKIRNVKKVTYR